MLTEVCHYRSNKLPRQIPITLLGLLSSESYQQDRLLGASRNPVIRLIAILGWHLAPVDIWWSGTRWDRAVESELLCRSKGYSCGSGWGLGLGSVIGGLVIALILMTWYYIICTSYKVWKIDQTQQTLSHPHRSTMGYLLWVLNVQRILVKRVCLSQ